MTPPPRGFQKEAIRNLFLRLNPDEDIGEIDLEAYLDSGLSLEENIQNYRKAYPQFAWQGEPRPSTREILAEEFSKIIKMARDIGLSERQIRDAAEEAGIPIERIQRIKGVPKEQFDEIKRKLDELKSKIGEVVPIGKPKAVPVEIKKPVPPVEKAAPTAIEARASRFVDQIGQRILRESNYYAALGLNRDAKTEDIFNAVRLYISTFHPDVYPSPSANEITRKLIEIRDTLTDPALKSRYDRSLGVPTPPTVSVAVGRPVVYCTQCQTHGRLVVMEYRKTVGPFESTGRSYDIYECPDPTCKKERVANFARGVFIGFGK